MADAIGVSGQTIYRWERGEGSPDANDIKQLCEVLGCTESELLNGPSDDTIEVTLRFVSKLKEFEGGKIDMAEAKGFHLELDANGAIGIHGAALFKNRDELRKAVKEITDLLINGYNFQIQNGRLTEA